MKILMLCIGNICRSPIAEGVLQSMSDELALGWEVESAAVRPYHIGSPPHQDSIRVCAENDLDISGQKARLFTPEDIEDYDIIYVMASDVMEIALETVGMDHPLIDKLKFFMRHDPEAESLDLLDPWYGGYDGYVEVYNTISRASQQIIEEFV